MTTLQAFIIVMGIIGQILVARRDSRGYLAWIAGNLALIVVYQQTRQFGLIGLQAANIFIQITALASWCRERSKCKSQAHQSVLGEVADSR